MMCLNMYMPHTNTLPLKYNTVAKQAKALRQRLRVQQGEGSDLDEDDVDDDDAVGGKLWGKKRRLYYGEDEEGATDEDEV